MKFGTFTSTVSGNVQYIDSERGEGLLVYHHGTPAAGRMHDDLLLPAAAANLRIVELVRPGYGESERLPGRSIADVVPLADALAAHLGFETYVTMGWSGGGPHALANAALSDRCVAAMCLAGVGMFGESSLDFLAGMGQENIDEFGAAIDGEEALRVYLDREANVLRYVSGGDVIEAMSTLLPQADRELLTDEYATWFAEELRWSVANGIDGWLDDDLAFTKDWGFKLADVHSPITLWQGREDLMVPSQHGEWLADRLPDVEAHLLEGHGHLSIAGPATSEGFGFLSRRL